ncbi:MAG: xanthine dehydrogenase family protein molybdopterin-binding subunit [Planctomycetes bacterium]|nr:xanthine dehydrogenase family protein molybdopterin-binding subunit [Planctomycetota bacterium]
MPPDDQIPTHTVGQRLERLDARAKVLGTARYADDLTFPGLLHLKVVFSTEPHARVRAIRTDAARRAPGVRAVLTAKDCPGENLIPLVLPDLTLMAADRVRFVGDPVAAVVADTPEAAHDAARLVEVDYEPLPAVFDVLEALRPGAPVVAPPVSGPGGHGGANTAPNLFNLLEVKKGDLAAGFEAADVVVEQEYRTPYQAHAYLETQGMTCVPEPDGVFAVYGCMQCPFYVHEAVARVLGVPRHRVKVIQVGTGGGFGGKEDVPSIIAGLAALGAWHTGRPVKLVLSRKEDFETMSKRHPALVRLKVGAKEDGTLTALEERLWLDGGAYATLSPVVLYRAVTHAAGPYRWPAVHVTGHAVATNKVPCGAFRGFGTLQVIFALESILDELAERLGLDPLDLRLKNAVRVGDALGTNQALTESVGFVETLERAAEVAGYREKRERYKTWQEGPKRRGVGLGCLLYGVGLGAKGKFIDRTGAHVQLYPDGSCAVSIGNAEMGQGLRTVISQIAAEELGLEFGKVQTFDGDTSRVPDSGPTVASRATVMAGNAVRDACGQIRRELLAEAGLMLGASPEELELFQTWARVKGAPERRAAMNDVIARAAHARRPLTASGFRLPADTWWSDDEGQGKAYEVYTYATNVCEVEVDLETGESRVLSLTAAHDIGRAINPTLAEGQIEGGALQGLGFALTEEVQIDQGVIRNPRFATYIIPTAMDSPELKAVIVEHPYSGGPYGAKGIGEPPIMGIAPAVTNAIKAATGARLFECPATPERVTEAMKSQGVAARDEVTV